MYIDIARPAICKKNGNDLNGDMDPLWLTCKAEKESNISRLVIAFFRQNADLHITTTTLRALVEIQADQMHKKGTISLVEREAIANSNGHCLNSTVGVWLIYYIYTIKIIITIIITIIIITIIIIIIIRIIIILIVAVAI